MTWTCPRCGTEFADGHLLEWLTSAERQVLQCLVNGRRPEKIAADLGISRHTIRTHLQNLYVKLDVHSQVEAVNFAIRNGMMPDGAQ
ncbi:MAG TPA: helix-turn-helix transcriptional regulator [Actinomycetes bacterium]|jgi:DNA-binding CsgD family transcriptional regulator|nr:helix-turn-helix transcriptional regulator [Actinomycetes bacterium]